MITRCTKAEVSSLKIESHMMHLFFSSMYLLCVMNRLWVAPIVIRYVNLLTQVYINCVSML